MKSYVTIERRLCLACNTQFETGNILMDQRLRDRFDQHTTTGYGLCPKHTLPGYVTILEVDPSKSTIVQGRSTVKPEDAYRTGRMMLVREEKAAELFNLPEGAMCCFMEIDAFTKILEVAGDNVQPLTIDDVKEIRGDEVEG